MAKLIKNVPVAFNLLDPDQKAMFQYVSQRTNKSSYLKRLIQRDMEVGFNVHSLTQQEDKFDEELMEGLI